MHVLMKLVGGSVPFTVAVSRGISDVYGCLDGSGSTRVMKVLVVRNQPTI